MSFHIFSSNSNHINPHNRWLSGIAIIFGYLWVVSGLDKLLGGKFAIGFTDFAKDKYLNTQSVGWYKHLMTNFIVPNGFFFAQIIQWGELLIGIALIVAGIYLLFRYSRIAHIVITYASLGSFLIVLNVILAEGMQLFPLVNTSVVYDEGVGLDTIVLLISALMVFANLNESRRDKIKQQADNNN